MVAGVAGWAVVGRLEQDARYGNEMETGDRFERRGQKVRLNPTVEPFLLEKLVVRTGFRLYRAVREWLS